MREGGGAEPGSFGVREEAKDALKVDPGVEGFADAGFDQAGGSALLAAAW
jgi:hypothetical protein